MSTAIDETDRQLLDLLAEQGRLPTAELARRVSLSRPAVHQRLRRLEESGVIRGYRAELDWSAAGYPVTVFVLVRVVGATAHPVATAILGFRDEAAFVDECYRVAGDWSLLIRIRAADPPAFESLIDRVRALPSVNWTHSAVTLAELHSRMP